MTKPARTAQPNGRDHTAGACWWCHGPVVRKPRGRWRKYCKDSCRQRAYEQRKLNRAIDWVAYGQRRMDRLHVTFDVVAATWRERVRRGETSDDARAMWSDMLDVRYPLWARRRFPVVAAPRHRRPQWRDVGDCRPGTRMRRVT